LSQPLPVREVISI